MQTMSFTNNIITFETPSYFITLLDKTTSAYKFEIECSLLQSEIFLKSLNKMIINVIIPASPILQNKTIINQNAEWIDLATDKINRTITSVTTNLQYFVNEAAIGDLKSGKPPENITALYALGEVLESNKDDYDSNIDSLASYGDIQNLNLSLISNFLIDPSVVASTTILEKDNPIITKLKNFYLKNALSMLQKDSEYLRSVEKNKFKNKINIKSVVEIPIDKIQSNNVLNLAFEIYETNNILPIYRTNKDLDINKYELLYSLKESMLAPVADIVSNKLYVSHKNKTCTIKKKQLNYLSMGLDSVDYAIVHSGDIGEIDLDTNYNSISIYQCLINDTNNGVIPYFKNIITGDPGTLDRTILTIESYLLSGIKLIITNYPIDAIKFKILRRHRFEGSGKDDYIEIAAYRQIDSLGTSYFIDNTVQHNQMYEYKVFYKLSDGRQIESISQIYKYINSPLRALITTSINEVDATQKDALRFNIVSTMIQDDRQKIKKLLSHAGLQNDYGSTADSRSDTIHKLLVYFVVRINLKTGESTKYYLNKDENVSNNSAYFIDDVTTQNINSAIDPTADYMYEVRAIIQDPKATVKGNLGRGTSHMNYVYDSYKWHQPHVRGTGVISEVVTSDILDTGDIGVLATYKRLHSSQAFELENLFAERLDSNKIKISWTVKDNATFDHLLLIKEVNKKRKFVGAVVSTTIDIIDSNDLGTIIYYIIPILNDYSLGSPYRTNTIIINPK